MRPIVCLLLLFVQVVSVAQIRPRMRPSEGSPEWVPIDSRKRFYAAQLAMKGKAGESELLALTKSKELDWQRAAYLAMSNSDNLKWLPQVLSLYGSKNSYLIDIAVSTVLTHPLEAWPILVKGAKGGNASLLVGIWRYVDWGPPLLRELVKHKSEAVRERAVGLLSDPKVAVDALNDPSRRVVRAAVQVLDWRRVYDKLLATHPNGRVRAAFAEFAQRGAKQDMSLFVPLARDKNPEVRRWAMPLLAYINVKWQYDENAMGAILAVRDAIKSGPFYVRDVAINVARSWITTWDDTIQFWTQEEILAARGVFSSPQFREAAYAATLKYGASPTEPGNGVSIGSACEALAISGDPRAFETLTRFYKLEEDPKYLESLGYVRELRAWDYLYRMLLTTAHKPYDATNQHMTSQTVWACIRGFSRLGEMRSYEPILKLYSDATLSRSLRGNLLVPFSWLKDKRANDLIIQVASDVTTDDFYRHCAIQALERMEDDRVDAILQKLATADAKASIRSSAEQAIKYREAWKSYRKAVG